ncbi:MAG: hypothetical protein IPK80_00360 [Nannocystis sp.]|nr:hypothetical protein [Nannocystis sp.]
MDSFLAEIGLPDRADRGVAVAIGIVAGHQLVRGFGVELLGVGSSGMSAQALISSERASRAEDLRARRRETVEDRW